MKKNKTKTTKKQAAENLDVMVRSLETKIDPATPTGVWTCRRIYCV